MDSLPAPLTPEQITHFTALAARHGLDLSTLLHTPDRVVDLDHGRVAHVVGGSAMVMEGGMPIALVPVERLQQ